MKRTAFDASIGKQKRLVELKLATNKGALYKADCIDFLSSIASNTVDCIFADPPFNLGKSYGSHRIKDSLPDRDYLEWTKRWLLECVRVLKPGGSFFIYHVPKWLIPISSYLNSLDNMEFRHWIAVKMKNGFPIRNRLHPAHYGLLYFVKKGKRFKFHVVRTPSPVCRHCGELIRDYGGYRKRYKTTKDTDIPLIQLADVWDDATPNIHHKSRPKTINELPLSIPERAILLSTNKGDVVLDPFSGGGSTLHAAEIHGRYWLGSELGTTTHASRRILKDAKATSRNNLPSKLGRILRTDK